MPSTSLSASRYTFLSALVIIFSLADVVSECGQRGAQGTGTTAGLYQRGGRWVVGESGPLSPPLALLALPPAPSLTTPTLRPHYRRDKGMS